MHVCLCLYNIYTNGCLLAQQLFLEPLSRTVQDKNAPSMSDSFLPTPLHSSPSSTLHNVLSSSSPVSSHSIMPISPLSSSLSSHSSFTSPSKVSSNPATGSLVMNFSPPTSTLSHSCPNPPHSPRSPQRIKLTNTDIETLFANIRELYALNSDLLKELIATCKLPRHQRNVGKCFLQRV